MSYEAEISRANPSCFLFLLDQSGSMADSFPGESGSSKADQLATIINRWLTDLVIKCSKDEGVRHYFDVGVIGYGRQVGPALSGPLAGKLFVSVTELAESPARVEDRTQKVSDGAGGLVEQSIKFPVWIDAKADHGTPMCQAMDLAGESLSGWIRTHADAFPPVVINITDGESTDGDPSG